MSETDKGRSDGVPAQYRPGNVVGSPLARSGLSRPGTNTGFTGDPNQGMGGRFLLDVLRRWWRLALPAGVLLAALGGVVVYWLFEPTYEASAWIKIEERPPYAFGEANRESTRSQAFTANQIELLRGPQVLSKVMARPEISQLPEIKEQRDQVKWLSKRISVKPVGQAGATLYIVSYSSSSARSAADVVNAVWACYEEVRKGLKQPQQDFIRNFLTPLITDMSNKVKGLEEDVENLARKVTQADPLAASSMTLQTGTQPSRDLRDRMMQTELDKILLDANIKSLQNGIDKGLAEVRNVDVDRALAQSVQQRSQEFVVREQQLQDIEAKSARGKDDPLYVQKREKLERDRKAFDSWLEKERARVKEELRPLASAGQVDELRRLQLSYDGLVRTEKYLKEKLDEQMKGTGQGTAELVRLQIMRADLDIKKNALAALKRHSENLEIGQAAPDGVELWRAAEPPPAPIEAFPLKGIGLASLVGFCVPFGLAFLWEKVARRVTDSAHLERSNLAVLGEVARLPTRTVRAGRSESKRVNLELRTFEESIDALRTRLTLAEDTKDARVFAVTSAANNEGKTSVAAQLAVSMARSSGELVLLIDGDMRSPDVHGLFEVPREPGLVEVLKGTSDPDSAIVTSWSKCLHLLPAGTLTSSPHRLLSNGAMEALLERLVGKYRYVIIDTPPVLAASEALVLARAADASVVCVMRDVSRLDQVSKAYGKLMAAGSRPMGMVFNGVPTKRYAYRYGSYAYKNGD